MSNLSYKIEAYLGRTVNFHFRDGEVLLQDDMIDDVSNPYIKYWSESIELPQPTAEQLDAVDATAISAEAEVAVINTRQQAYPQLKEFAEAYTEKEIGGDNTKWNEYVTKYNKVRTDNPK